MWYINEILQMLYIMKRWVMLMQDRDQSEFKLSWPKLIERFINKLTKAVNAYTKTG